MSTKKVTKKEIKKNIIDPNELVLKDKDVEAIKRKSKDKLEYTLLKCIDVLLRDGLTKQFIYDEVLKPLILHNYNLRAEGKIKDKWFWADALAVEWGYFTR